MACGCEDTGCNCVIQGANGMVISGGGTLANPYVVTPPATFFDVDMAWVSAHSPIEQQNVPIYNVQTAVTVNDNSLYLTKFTALEDIDIATLYTIVATAGNITADQENRMGLYTSDGTNFTLVASTPNDATAALWETPTNPGLFPPAGITSADLSTPYSAVAGEELYIGMLFNWSAVVTSPQLARANIHSNVTGILGADGVYGGHVAGHNTLPASVAIASITTLGQLYAGVSA